MFVEGETGRYGDNYEILDLCLNKYTYKKMQVWARLASLYQINYKVQLSDVCFFIIDSLVDRYVNC